MKSYKTELYWSFSYIAFTLIWMWLEKVSGLHSTRIDLHEYFSLLIIVPVIYIYVLALKAKKKQYYGGQISYAQAFFSGALLTFIISLFSPLMQWVISTLISPDYFKNVINYSLQVGYYKSYEEASSYFNLKNYMIQSTIGAFVMGIVTTAIVAYFIRSKNKLNENPTIYN